MVDIIFKNRRIVIPTVNLVSYIASIILMVILFSVTLPGLSSPPLLNPDPTINQIIWIHITAINFWILCLFGLVPPMSVLFEDYSPHEVLPIISDEKQQPFDRDFYLARSDGMDRLIHYQRSGISILLGIVIAIILWLLAYTAPLPPMENAFLLGSVSLAFFAVLALLVSFGDTRVRAYGVTLEEDLIPHSQTPSQYIAQIREMLLNKRKINRQMKKSIGFGLLLFITVPAMYILEPIYSAIPIVPTEPLVGTLSSISIMLMAFVLIIVGLVLVGNLGLKILPDDQNEVQ